MILQKRMNYTSFVGCISDYCGLASRLHMMWLKLEPSQSFIWHYTHVYNIFKKVRHIEIIPRLLLTIDSLVSCHSLREYFVRITKPLKRVYVGTGMNCIVIRIPDSGRYTEGCGIVYKCWPRRNFKEISLWTFQVQRI